MLFKLIARAVDEQNADAVLLSGGIDSSTVAALAADLPCLTGWYAGSAYDERPWAEHVIGHRDWHQIEITQEDFIRVFDNVARILNDARLRCGPGAVGQYVVAEVAADLGYKSLLSGEGGDELFGGYARQHIVAGLDPPDGYEQYELPEGYPKTIADALEFEWDALRDLCAVDTVIAAAHGVTVTPPLLNPWVVAYAVRLPVEERIQKRALRKAMRGLVPDEILDRTDKRGFPAPFVEWAQRGKVRDFVKDRIGYVPDPEKPWDRKWWYEMLDASLLAAAA